MDLELQRVLAENLRAHRAARRMTQLRFAELLGKKRQFVGEVEKGSQNLRLSTVEGVAIQLGVPPHSLFIPADVAEFQPAQPEPAASSDVDDQRRATGDSGA